MGKSHIFDQNHGLTTLEKSQFFFIALTCCFYSLERRFFLLKYRKTHFPGLYYLKKKMGKRPIFDQNHGKNLNFSTVWTCCFYSLKRCFFLLEYRKTHFPALYCLKKNNGKIANFWPKPWVNHFGKIFIA